MSSMFHGAASPPIAMEAGALRGLAMPARAWFVVATLGQWLFSMYVVVFYGGALIDGQPQRWNEVLPQGHVPGDTFGNLVLGLHLLFAVTIMAGGTLQCIPALRRRWPSLHRWNGRFYMLFAVTLAMGGLYLTWLRVDEADHAARHLGTTLNALLILACGGLAWWHARGRRFDAHRRWALRLFLVVSGVWFFRIGLMLWIVAVGPVGFDPATFSGPTLTVLAFAQTLLPLAVLELYFRAARGEAWLRALAAASLWMAVAVTAAGIAAATMILWWPRM